MAKTSLHKERGDSSLSPDSLRTLLTSFWGGSLEIETTTRGLVFTMPVSYPDGWQVILELSQKTPGGYYLNDRGKTLGWLGGRGLNVETDAVKAHLQRLCAEHYLAMEHGVLHRWLPAPLDPTDIHVFAEGLVAIWRLDILNEHRRSPRGVQFRRWASTILKEYLTKGHLYASKGAAEQDRGGSPHWAVRKLKIRGKRA